MRINRFQQRGISGTALIISIAVLIVVLMVFFKLFPLYMDNMKIGNILPELVEDPNTGQKMDNQIQIKLLQELSDKGIDDLFNQDTLKEHLLIERDGAQVTLTLDYQRITKFMGNVSFLVEFKNYVGNN